MVNFEKSVLQVKRYKLQRRFRYLLMFMPLMIIGALFPMFGGYDTNRQGTDFWKIEMAGWTTQGSWIYFSDNGGLYKMDSRNGSVKKLADGSFLNLNVVGDWLYYYTEGTLCKIRTNGRDNTVLDDSEPWYGYIMVIDNYIYYTTDGGRKLFMMNTNGSGTKQIGSNTLVIGMDGGRLIAADYIGVMKDVLGVYIDPRTKIYSMDIDGSNKKLLFETENLTLYSGIYIRGRNLYYCTYNGKSVIVNKFDMTTGKTTIVFDKNAIICGLSDGWIYYQIKGNDLFKASLDGNSDKQIATWVQDAYIQIGDWIVYRDRSGQVYRTKEGSKDKDYIGTKVPDEK